MTEDNALTVRALRARVKPETAQWITVRADEKLAKCQRCDADQLYWGRTANGKPLLVDCGVDGGYVPSPKFPAIELVGIFAKFKRAASSDGITPEQAALWTSNADTIARAINYHDQLTRRGVAAQLLEGRGVAHFATCPRADSFRKGGER